MTFIGHLCKDSEWKKNRWFDGQWECAYHDFPQVFERLQSVFENAGIQSENVIALECENSLPAALTLMFLLENGYRFALLPKKSSKSAGNTASIPQMCHFALEVNSVSLTPSEFLRIESNQNFVPGDETKGIEKLYLRTSGSTGIPKLAEHEHDRLKGNADNCVERLKLKSNDRIAIPVPIYHMFGLGAALLPAAAIGASVDLQKGANILSFLQHEKQFQPNMAFLTPIFCEILLKRRSFRKYQLTVVAGDRMRGTTFSDYEEKCGNLVQLYGSTEMGAIAAGSPDDTLKVRSTSVGRPMNGVQLRTGGSMDLWCSHPCGFEKYVDETGTPLDVSPFDEQGWFSTKDLGTVHEDGTLEVKGRADHSVNRDGLLVFFADIEKKLCQIPGIEMAVIIAGGEEKRGRKLTACCVASPKATMETTEIRNACNELLPKHAVPDEFVLRKELPLLGNGKVDRQMLENLIQNGQ